MKSKKIAYFLWFIGCFGILGLHRFYLRKGFTGLLWLYTLGLCGIGALYDFFALESQVYEYNMNVEYEEDLKAEYKTI